MPTLTILLDSNGPGELTRCSCGWSGSAPNWLSRGVRDADRPFRDTLGNLPVVVTVVTGTGPGATVTYATRHRQHLLGDITGQAAAQVLASRQVRAPGGRRVEQLQALRTGDGRTVAVMEDVTDRLRTGTGRDAVTGT